MRKADKIKLLSIISISLILFLSGCVDTSVQPIQSSFNFRSQIKIVNLAPNTGSAAVTMAIASGGSNSYDVAYGDESPASGQPFSDVPAGSKTFDISYTNGGSNNFKIVTETDMKMRLFILSDTTNTRSLVKSTQRYVWQTKGSDNGKGLYPADTAQLAFVNGCPDVSVSSLIFHVVPTDTTIADINVSVSKGDFLGGRGYAKVKAGSYSVFVVAGKDTVATMSFNGQSQGRYTAVIYDRLTNIQNKIFTDD
ncbi:MAG TPA: hypothetical protein VJ954_05530 [Ignavibacteriaceae bacterium]|nr:hypothetical protein [Ignavibacteriaceae bacterium]